MQMHHLFAYGTLKRGDCRSQHMDGQRYLCDVQTEPLYRMFDCGSYPGLILDHHGVSIAGELWQIDDDCLLRLDVVEGVSDNWFRRDLIKLAPPYERLSVFAYYYMHSTIGLPDCSPSWPVR